MLTQQAGDIRLPADRQIGQRVLELWHDRHRAYPCCGPKVRQRRCGVLSPTRTGSIRFLQLSWERGRNSAHIGRCLERFDLLSRNERELLLVGISLESGTRPLIHQYGYAEFRPVEDDHRLITVNEGASDDETADSPAAGAAAAGQPGEGSSSVGAGSAAVRAAPEGAEAGTHARGRLTRSATLAQVIEEDSRDLPLYFPQFTSQVLYDDRWRMWYREGWLQPLGWHPARFQLRYYYPAEALALPIIVAAPIQCPSPHLWKQQFPGQDVPSLCYTFAPDRTIDRSRDSDVASEVLRQVVLWLIKHMVWCRFGFWPGPEVGHDPIEILRATAPDDPCPMHTWQRYGDCCQPAHLKEFERRRPLRLGINPARRVDSAADR